MGDGIEEIMPIVMTKPKRGQEMTSTPVNEELYHEGYVEGVRYLVPDSNLEAMKDIINLKMRQRKSTRYKHQTSYELADYEHFKLKLTKLLTKIDEVSSSSSSGTSESTGYEYINSSLLTGEEERTDSGDKSTANIFDERESDSSLHKITSGEEENTGIIEYDSELNHIVDGEERISDTIKSDSESELNHIDDGEERISDTIKSDSESEDLQFIDRVNSKEEESRGETTDRAPSLMDNLEPEEIKNIVTIPLSETPATTKLDKKTINNIETTKKSKEQQDTSPRGKSLRFLISGHFQEGKKPIYIIQQYDGAGNILGEQTADFVSRESKGETSIVIAGKFYKGNILEEHDDKPAFLNTKPNKIEIDPETSKIYHNCFEEKVSMPSVDITINGKFIKNYKNMTPFIAFNVKHKSVESKKHSGYDQNGQPTTILYNSGMKMNPFVQYLNGNHTKSNEEFNQQQSVNQYKTKTYTRRIIDNCYYFTRPELIMAKEITLLCHNKSMMNLLFWKKKHSRKNIHTSATFQNNNIHYIKNKEQMLHNLKSIMYHNASVSK